MTDRELLELAAKAAGKPLRELDDLYDRWESDPVQIQRGWNPLEHDGDALRLAVKLRLDVLQNPMGQTACCIVTGDDAQECEVFEDYNADDPYAATRRAIVRAAAEIGRGTAT